MCVRVRECVLTTYIGSGDAEVARTAEAMGDDELVAGQAEGDAGFLVGEVAAVAEEDAGGGNGRAAGGAADGGLRGPGGGVDGPCGESHQQKKSCR